MELEYIENQLKKRWELPYTWGRKQNDVWDRQSGFIYEIKDWDLLKQKISKVSSDKKLNPTDFLNYCSNRWYNFNSARAIEGIFRSMDGIIPAQNSKDKLVDFKLFGIDFDHKTSVFPVQFGHNLQYAKEHPERLIEWLYKNQSSEQRQHYSNRLFLIVYSKNGEHWKIKAELFWLKNLIEEYVLNFKAEQLQKLICIPGKTTYSDLIWAIK